MDSNTDAVRRFRERLDAEYDKRFRKSREHYARYGGVVLDRTSHAIRWNEPFLPVTRRADGAAVEDLDGHRIIDYWQGHFANLFGHNPKLIRAALARALDEGRGLQTGMVHEIEAEVCERISRCTGGETVRLTTSGSLGTFYAVLLARAFTGREEVLKVAGGWHGSQPFGLKGVSAVDGSFDHLESEGLSADARSEIRLTRFNDADDLRKQFERDGDRIACFLIEPVLGSGGGMVGSTEYLREARRLTERHGALLICDEIITGFRFRAGDLSSMHGVRPDLLVLGKILGGGMPVAAVAGRREVMQLCCRGTHRVKFEGGTYSAHELSLVASRTMLREVMEQEQEIYGALARLGAQLRERIAETARAAGVPVAILGASDELGGGSSLVYVHVLRDGAPAIRCPEDLAQHAHPRVSERLLRSVLMLEGVSVRSGLGAVSTSHGQDEIERTAVAYRVAFERLRHGEIL